MTYKFTPGEYLTRDGRKAVVLCDDAPGNHPIIGYIMDGKNAMAREWMQDGRFCANVSATARRDDLIAPVTEPEQVVRLVTLYPDNLTRTTPKVEVGSPLGNPIARTRVVLTPGVFEDENTPSEYDRGWNEALEAARVQFAHDFGGSVRDDVMRKIRALKRSAP